MISFETLYDKRCIEMHMFKEVDVVVELYQLKKKIHDWADGNSIKFWYENKLEKDLIDTNINTFDLHFENENDEVLFRLTWL